MSKFKCSVCGQMHDGLPAWALHKPDYWLTLTPDEQSKSKIDQDLCMTHDGFYFVRAVLVVPLIDGPQDTFEFGPWTSLSEENFKRYVQTFSDNDQSKLGSMFGYLSNELRGFPASLNLKCQVWPRDNNQRPSLELEPTDHPLAVAQREGITFEKALKIVHQQ